MGALILFTVDDVAEFDHVIDLSPTMLANPSAVTSTVRAYDGRDDIPVGIRRRADPVVFVLNKFEHPESPKYVCVRLPTNLNLPAH